MKDLRFRLLVPVLALGICFASHAQSDDDGAVLEADFAITTAEAQQRAAADLRTLSDEQRKSGNFAQAARLLNRAGRFQIRMFRLNDAVLTFKEALQLIPKQPDTKIRVDLLDGLSSAYENQSACDLAEPLLAEAVNLSRQNNYVAGEAEALWIRSDCEDLRDHSKALESAQKSLELWQSINSKRGMAQAYMTIGKFHMAQSNLMECTRNLEAALNLYRELNSVERQTVILIYFGYIEQRKGAWQNALNFFAQAQSLTDEKSEPFKMGQISTGIGEVFLESGLPEIAVGKFREALEHYVLAQSRRAETATKWQIGRAQYLSGEYKPALETLLTARNEAAARKDVQLLALCDDFLGRTYAALADSTAALGYFESALTGFTQAKSPMEAARTRVLLGGIYQRQAKYDLARKEYLRSLESFRSLSDHVNESAALYALGDLELHENNLETAVDYLRQSIDVTENMRRISTSRDLTASLSAQMQDRYERYVECLMRLHQANPDRGLDARAFETSELARARSLAELLRATRTEIAEIDPNLSRREVSLRLSLRVKEDARVNLLAGDYKQTDLNRLNQELGQLESEYQDVKSQIRQRYPAFEQIMQPAGSTLADIQREVLSDGETLLLEYSLGNEHSYLWAVTGADFYSYELPARAEIENAARHYYQLLTVHQRQRDVGFDQYQEQVKEAEAELPQMAAKLSQMLLAPVAGKIGRKRLVIVADGALQYIPFQTLTLPVESAGSVNREPRPILLDHEIVNEPSASILALVNRESANRREVPGSVAVLADPVFDVGDTRVNLSGAKARATPFGNQQLSAVFRDLEQTENGFIPRLMASRDEARAIMSIVPWNTGFEAVDFSANRANLTAGHLDQYRIVHFATHAYLDDGHPERSGVVLSLVDEAGHAQPGYVEMNDIYNLRLPVSLVVLSACNSGLGKQVRGEGLIGLTRGFMYAGASGVVASLWKVDDEATAELMKRFYRGMFQDDLSPAAALRQAQIAMWQQKRWHAPYYWAGFVIQGRSDQKERWGASNPGAQRIVVIAAVLSVVILAACLVLGRRRSHSV
jgi:CHAT domain-containing protein